MRTRIAASRASWTAWRARQSRVTRLILWLLATLSLSLFVGHTLGLARSLTTVLTIFSSIALVPLLLILLYRWIAQRMLWTVRNRLILTYLLMGLAPVVLFGTLSGIGAYLLAGQYATSTALLKLEQASTLLKEETTNQANQALANEVRPGRASNNPTKEVPVNSEIFISVLRNTFWRPLIAPVENDRPDTKYLATHAPPPWLHPPFDGIVAIDGQLYLCSQINLGAGKRLTPVLGTIPLDRNAMDQIASGLGKITFYPGFSKLANGPDLSDVQELGQDPLQAHPEGAPADTKAESDSEWHYRHGDSALAYGGFLPPSKHFYDTPVFFGTPTTVIDWETGKRRPILMVVVSRPSLLFAHLFSSSGGIGTALRAEFAGVAIFFGLLELLALIMAVALSRTITRSVTDLYRGTRAIDAGNLDHRIRVARHDQLGALATSFNSMAASITDLLLQQREKERLLTELAIAQEVQATLFPRSPASLPHFEIHAVCRPARTIGGDYFDFIFSPDPDPELCFALGDISGKGISAALLMASLHSAVRSFRLGCGVDGSAPLSPALLLKFINRHLYQSTQSARYATLFLACYDGASRKLTYSNGGHLPPLVLSARGSVQRLTCGGSVVGLLEGLEYSESTVQLESGDLLLAYTDGLTEPENSVEEFGEQRLLDYIHANRQQPLPILAANTLRILGEWIGDREQPDDMTLLLARQL